MSPAPESQPAFQRLQYRFAAHLRDPQANPAPEGIEDRRLQIYRDLFINSMEGLLRGNFPVLHRLLEGARWNALVREFYAHHPCHTPLFPEIAREFLRFLDARGEPDPPFLLELAHYEWVELALAIDETELADIPHHREGDLLAGVPVVNPLAWPLLYRFPVQRIRPDFQPREAPEQPTGLLVIRDRGDEVRFMEASPLTLRLVERLNETPELSGRAHLEALAAELGQPLDAVLEPGAQMLERLRQRQAILGIAPG
ncbi:MAG TPA: putative DNA-binding domain-containing protein [Xanthomonadaceae bacterium]|nr:putative DNA-binding domain-containing protein [Xanthomonadaceae bacterium]